MRLNDKTTSDFGCSKNLVSYCLDFSLDYDLVCFYLLLVCSCFEVSENNDHSEVSNSVYMPL